MLPLNRLNALYHPVSKNTTTNFAPHACHRSSYSGAGRSCRLYAALAGVDNPTDAFLQPSPRHNLSKGHRPYGIPARSSAPEGPCPNSDLPLRLRAVGRAPSTPKPPSPLQGDAETQTPTVKRARSPSYGSFPPKAVTEGAAASPNDIDIDNHITYSPLVRDCKPHLQSGREASLSTPAEAQQQQRKHQRSGTTECKTWKMQLKEDMATGREPLKTFVFAGQSK